MPEESTPLDILVVGAGPTGISVGAEATEAGLTVLLVDRGALTASLLGFPTFMRFFTTRDRLEVGRVPFTVPDEKPDRRQALTYYRAVVDHYRIPVATHEEVVEARSVERGFSVRTRAKDGEQLRSARAVVIATGYFDHPRRLGVPGESEPFVRSRYLEPFEHFGEHVVVVGGGNSACETALELWRAGGQVTVVHRGADLKPTVKYWLRPDMKNRIAEGSIAARFETQVVRFDEDAVVVRTVTGEERLAADAVYALIGYRPDADLQRRCGVDLDPESLVPHFDPDTGETNVPGLYVAGAVQSGVDTGKIFIDNSRDHSVRIVRHIAERLRKGAQPESVPTG